MADGYIYAQLARTLRVVKVGKAKNPYARRGELQVGCPVPLITYAVRQSDDMARDEMRVHQAMSKWRLPGRREWFQFNHTTRSYLKSWRKAACHGDMPPVTIEEIMEAETLPVLVPRQQVVDLLSKARTDSSKAIELHSDIVRKLISIIRMLTPRQILSRDYMVIDEHIGQFLERNKIDDELRFEIIKLCQFAVEQRNKDLREVQEGKLRDLYRYVDSMNKFTPGIIDEKVFA